MTIVKCIFELALFVWQTAFIRDAVTLPALYFYHIFDFDCDFVAFSIDLAISSVISIETVWQISNSL